MKIFLKGKTAHPRFRETGTCRTPGRRRRHYRTAVPAAAFLLLLFSFGCGSIRETVSGGARKPLEPSSVYRPTGALEDIRRTVMLPLFYEPYEGEFLHNMDKVFLVELSKTARFEVVSVNREQMDAQFKERQLSSVGDLPADFLESIRRRYGADAVLLTDLTHYHPYKPISIGVRSKLVELKSGRILWAFDDVFDAGNRSVSVAARRYHLANNRNIYPLDNAGSVLQSPNRFSKFVAYEVFRSLPK